MTAKPKKYLTEHEEQCALVEWAHTRRAMWPELEYMYAVPNGAKLPYKKTRRGVRYSKEAIWLKREGLLPGVSDLVIPAARGVYHGLYIEMKAGNNKPTGTQIEFINAMRSFGYAAVVMWGWKAAAEFIEHYMSLKDGQEIDPKYLSISKPK